MIAVDQFAAAVPAEIAEEKMIWVITAGLAKIDELGILAPIAVIHAVLGILNALAVAAIFEIVPFETPSCILAVTEVVTGTAFEIHSVKFFHDRIAEERFHAIACCGHIFVASGIDAA